MDAEPVRRTGSRTKGTHWAVHWRNHNVKVVLVQGLAKSFVPANVSHVLKGIAVLFIRWSVLNSLHKP